MPDTVRVRFAPSPTGEPHVGNIRTALFNWLFARHHGGSFIVRVEDTDQERKVEGALESILESLQWMGLDWDEGPTGDAQGSQGPHGPYFQSQRLPMYQEAANRLLAQSDAYPCFCSPERLATMREEQKERKQPPGYDRTCLTQLTVEERQRRVDAGEEHVLRFKIPTDRLEVVVHDVIRGDVTWEPRLLDDFVMMKSDGFPTYHLANIVDDHSMEITHVMRAEEWLPSTPRHVLLYEALGWDPPVFAHMPMILGPDRAKLSKRHGATSTLEYRAHGFLPEALVNFMALIGWALDDHTEIFSMQDLIKHFSLDHVGKSGAIFDVEKLTWMNGLYIRSLSIPDLASRIQPFLERPAAEGGLPDDVSRPIDSDFLLQLTPLVQERMKTLEDVTKVLGIFFEETGQYDPATLVQKGSTAEQTNNALQLMLDKLEAAPEWDGDSLEASMRPLAEELEMKPAQLFGALRVAVTGRTVSPPLFETMEALGRDRSLEGLRNAVSALSATI
ncbi:MAG: glutamate--tRNA ligase [SAR202 cluster bacterium]|jgi:glutamyl-tRNA synthetase|nr:glutamate--tRNA ligase [SAR202 cluster bacterium]